MRRAGWGGAQLSSAGPVSMVLDVFGDGDVCWGFRVGRKGEVDPLVRPRYEIDVSIAPFSRFYAPSPPPPLSHPIFGTQYGPHLCIGKKERPKGAHRGKGKSVH